MLQVFLQQDIEAFFGFFATINQVFQGAWIEGLIIALALYIFLFHSTSSGQTTAAKKTKARCGMAARTAGKAGEYSPGTSLAAFLEANNRGLGSVGDESEHVRCFVSNLLAKGGKCSPIVLDQYICLVKECRVDLRHHLPDDQNARSLFIALISIGVHASAHQLGSFGHGSAEGAWQLTLGFLADMRRSGFPRSLEFYVIVMKLHVQAQCLHEVLLLHDELQADGFAADQQVYVILLKVSICLGDTGKAIRFFDALSKLGPMSVRTYMTVLNIYVKNKDWRGAVKLLDRMEADGTPPDNLVLNHVLGLCVSLGQVDAVESLLPRFKGVMDVVSCNILLKGFTQRAQLQRADKLLAKMISDGPPPNLITFNTIMDCAVRALQAVVGNNERTAAVTSSKGGSPCGASLQFTALARRPWELLEQLSHLGLQPDRYTCSTLVKGMHLAGCSSVEIDRAVALLQRVGPVALQCGSSSGGGSGCTNARLVEVLFNTLLDACVTVRDLDRMGEIFQMMQEFKVGVSAVTFGTLIKAFGQAGRLSRCHEVWEDMRNSGIKPTIVTFGCYMDACIRNEDLTGASELFEVMQRRGVRPNAVVYTSLIRGYAQAKQPRKALELYRQMRGEGIEATCVTFNSILDVVARQLSTPAVLEEVMDDMREANIEPDVVTYSILLKASCSTGNIKNAVSLFQQIRSHGLVFDQVAFNTLLQACSKADHVADAEEVFEEMCHLGIMPTHVTTSILVKMYGKAHMLEKAIAVSNRIERDYGRKPNLFVYTCLIQACVQNKHVRQSWEIFNRMLEDGVEPDAITYGTVIHGCVYLNRFEHALTLVRHAYMRTPRVSGDTLFEVPFAVDIMPMKHVVALQPEVLQMLVAALRRKERPLLIAELELIMADYPAVEQQKSTGGKDGPRRRPGNRCTRGGGFLNITCGEGNS